jgi:hypothetical protein
MKLKLKMAFLCLSMLATVQCSVEPQTNLTSLNTLYAHPEYQDAQVKVFGRVKNKMTALGKTVFWLQDEDKSVMVRNSKKNPLNGEYIYVNGTVNIVLDLGGVRMIELVEDP